MTDNAPFDLRSFRDALGHFATGVTVITTLDSAGTPIGMTANSFSSVSLDPPLVLWSVARTSRSYSIFMEAPRFAIHVLSCDQEAVAMQFATSDQDRFANIQTSVGLGSVPLLEGCSARFECETEHRYEGGDHIILVGRVMAFENGDKDPLLFHRGRFARLETSVC